MMMRDIPDCDPRWARIAWAATTTPGDRLVSAAIDSFGPARALEVMWTGQRPREVLSLAGALEVEPSEIVAFRRRYPSPPSVELMESIRARCATSHFALLTPGEEGWPSRVADLGPFAPIVLFALGRSNALEKPASLGVVGTRQPGSGANQVCRRIVSDAAASGYTLVSGGARGIDWAAHEAASRLAAPQVMVLATALDNPGSWQRRFLGLLPPGAIVVTETPPGVSISAASFLHRNRLIAALSDRVLVVEAAERSGSLNTASHARKLGRDLSAVISRPRDASNAGCYRLVEEWGADQYVVSG